MRIGTIVKNSLEPLETYFVYTGEKAQKKQGGIRGITQGYGITRYGSEWKIRRDVYDVKDLEDPKKFPRVGYIDLEQVLIRDILKAIGIKETQ